VKALLKVEKKSHENIGYLGLTFDVILNNIYYENETKLNILYDSHSTRMLCNTKVYDELENKRQSARSPIKRNIPPLSNECIASKITE